MFVKEHIQSKTLQAVFFGHDIDWNDRKKLSSGDRTIDGSLNLKPYSNIFCYSIVTHDEMQ